MVWSGYTFEKLKTLSNHQSHVKGLTFDPANKYFATASDDRTIKVWHFTSPGPNSSAHDQANNFMLEKNITGPFTASPLTTYFRRCSWSPDGNHIAAANAVNGPVSSVAIINRGSWDGDIHLIGHEGPVEVCAFSPRLFSKQPPSKAGIDGKVVSSPHLVTVVACAGQDKALSIWITSNPRPLVITQNLATKSISDLAWTPDGKTLFLTSLDGTILAVVFGDGELGYEVPLEENEKSLAKFGGGRRGTGILESTRGLLLEEKSREGEIRGAEGRMGALMGDAVSSVTVKNETGASVPTLSIINGTNGVVNSLPNGHDADLGTNGVVGQSTKPQQAVDQYAAKLEKLKQRVTITKDGRKRIAPLLVSSSSAHESSLPRTQLVTNSANGQGMHNNDPQNILDLSKPFDGLPKGGLAALLLGNRRRAAVVEGTEDGLGDKRTPLANQDGAVPILLNSPDGLVPARPGVGAVNQPSKPEFIRPAVVNPSLGVSQLRLAVPTMRSQIVQNLGGFNVPRGKPEQGNNATDSETAMHQAKNPDTTIVVRNSLKLPASGRLQDSEPCRITVTQKGQPIWQDYLPRSVLLVTGNKQFWSAACEDGSVYVWTPAGRRIVNALVLESQPVFLVSQNQWLLCITAVGMCYVWDTQRLSSPHPPVSLAPVLDIAVHILQDHPTHAPSVTSANLNSEGRIIVTLSNGDGYAYSPGMYVWQRLSELWWAVGSQYWNTTDSSVGNLRSSSAQTSETSPRRNLSAGIIPFLERRTTHETLARGRAYFLQRLVKQLLSREGYEGLEMSVSVSHLENRLAAAVLLKAKDEFRVYLYMYAKRIGAEGQKAKVEELLRSLLGTVYEDEPTGPGFSTSALSSSSSSSSSIVPEPAATTATTKPTSSRPQDQKWDHPTDSICGWPRMELLKGVILILGKQAFHPLPSSPFSSPSILSSKQHSKLQNSLNPFHFSSCHKKSR